MSASRHAATQLRHKLTGLQHGGGFDTACVLTTLYAVLDEPETAVVLLAEVWPAVPPDANQDFVRQLSDIGARLAVELPVSLLLAKAFRQAARSLRTNGRLHLAAIHGMRELAIHRRRDNDPDVTAAALYDLADTYRCIGVPHKIIGCADEMLETYLLHRHQAGVARTLTHLGSLMIEVDRYDSAVKYLTRADKAYQQLPDTRVHAVALVLLGRALLLTGNRRTADRALNRALALAIGSGEDVARNVRATVEEIRPLHNCSRFA